MNIELRRRAEIKKTQSGDCMDSFQTTIGTEAGVGALNSDAPSMPEATIAYFAESLKTVKCYLEFGAGGSTLLAAKLGVPNVISVESDKAFLENLVAKTNVINSSLNFYPVYVDIGATGSWGRPVDTSSFTTWHKYSQAGFIAAANAGLEPDFILVDGRFRVSCFLAALLCALPGTRVLFDDYAGRSKYHVVEKYVRPFRMIDRAALFILPGDVDFRAVAFDLARYSVVPK
jgi:hypothetical protein